ncbi:MAG: sugar phosphate isomerase/epimerase [Planctomycetes bacterium]|nr:sugar phosphate isomerase/epimerase [Planctomycetota bacterium]
MRLSLSTHLFVYNKLGVNALQAMAACPLDSLEIWLARPHLEWRDAEAMAAFRAQLQEFGLSASSVHLPLYPSVPELLEQNIRWSVIDPDPEQRRAAMEGTVDGIRAANILGAKQAVFHLGWPADVWTDETFDLARSSMRELLQVAADCGVTLAIENLTSAGTSVAEILQLLDDVDDFGSGGICLDVGHANLEGDVIEIIRHAAPRMTHMHLHDNDGTGDQHRAPGDGNLDWTAIHQVLSDLNFDGYGAVEIRDYSKGETEAELLLHQSLHAASRKLPDLPQYTLLNA